MADPVVVVETSPPTVNGVNVDTPPVVNTANNLQTATAPKDQPITVDVVKVVNGAPENITVDTVTAVKRVDAVKVADGPGPTGGLKPTPE